MTPEQFARVDELFQRAIDLPPSKRAALVEQFCPDDALVRNKVLQMLAEDGAAQDRVDTAAIREQVAQELPEPVLPSRIGAYQIIRQLGEGGMGIIYEARQESPDRRVALKLLRPGLLSRGMLRRFQQEAQLLGQLQHAGIAQIYQAGLVDLPLGRQPYFAMEYIEGRPLDEHVRAAHLTRTQRLELFVRICDAVQHAHQRGIIHRDLKPANILVVSQDPNETGGGALGLAQDGIGQPKVLDFGIARTVDTTQAPVTVQTEAGQLIGTLAYMSPEQVGGTSADLDTRCDVYALGVVLYELLADCRPHDLSERPVPEAIRIVNEEEPAPLARHDRSLRGDLETIVAKAMAKDRQRRYGSAIELAADVRRYLQSEPVTARPPSMIYLASRFARRNRSVVAGTIIAFGALTIGLVVAVSFALDARASEAEARRVSYNALLTRAAHAFEEGDVEAARQAVENAPPEYSSWEHDYLTNQLIPSVYFERTLPRERYYHTVAWAAEGPRAIEVSEKLVRVVNLADGEVLAEFARAELHSYWPNLPAVQFTRDGRRIAWADNGACTAHIRDLDDQRQWSFDAWWLTVNETGTQLAHVLSGDSRELVVWDLEQDALVMRHPLSADTGNIVQLNPAGDLVTLGHGRSGIETLHIPTGTSLGRVEWSRDSVFAEWVGDSVLAVNSLLHSTSKLYANGVGTPVLQIDGLRTDPTHITASNDGQWLLISRGAATEFHSAATGNRIATLGPSMRACFSPSGEDILLMARRSIQLFPRAAASPAIVQDTKWLYHVAFSPDGSLLAAAGWSGRVQLWDTVEQCVVGSIPTLQEITTGLSFGEDGQRLFVASRASSHWDKREPEWFHRGIAAPGLEFWDVTTLQRSAEPPAPPWRDHIRRGGATQMIHSGMGFHRSWDGRRISIGPISRDNRLLAIRRQAGSRPAVPGHIRLYRLRPNDWLATDAAPPVGWQDEFVREMTIPDNELCFSLTFTRDGKRLLGGTRSGVVYVWEVATGEVVCKLNLHDDYIHQVVFSDDGTRLATASGDGTARILDSVPPSIRQVEREAAVARRAQMRATIESWRQAGVSPSTIAERLRANDTLTSADRLVLYASLRDASPQTMGSR